MSIQACGCRPDRYETHEIAKVENAASFRSVRVEKHDSTKWWEHEVTINVSYCKDLSEIPASAKDPRTFFPYPTRSSNDDLSAVVTGPRSLQIKAKMTRGASENAARMNEAMNRALQWYMAVPSYFAADGSFAINSEEKERVRSYDVFDRVERR